MDGAFVCMKICFDKALWNLKKIVNVMSKQQAKLYNVMRQWPSFGKKMQRFGDRIRRKYAMFQSKGLN